MSDTIDWELLRGCLCSLQTRLLERLLEARGGLATDSMAAVSDVTPADTIYAVDKISEDLILEWMHDHWPVQWPVELLMEGLEERGPVTFPTGTAVEHTLLKLIIDPIDGTRELMWDRRSAWAMAAIAPQRGAANRLADLRVAAMTELPTTRAWRSDQFSVVRGSLLVGQTLNLFTGERFPCTPVPHQGTSLLHGFSGLASPFPGAKEVVAAITERLFSRLEPTEALHTLPIFEDQYICTGGQFHDLMTGRLRFFGDLRPHVFASRQMPAALCAHPYDVCTALIAEAAGVVVVGLDGEPLDGTLDTVSSIAWVGYANAELAQRIHPILKETVAEVLHAKQAF